MIFEFDSTHILIRINPCMVISRLLCPPCSAGSGRIEQLDIFVFFLALFLKDVPRYYVSASSCCVCEKGSLTV
jgi:hypothetical protein